MIIDCPADECQSEGKRKWTLWAEQRPPNEAGAYRYRATFDLLGLTVTAEWTEKMSLCGMGYGDSEWWPLSPCYWDGYRRYITHKGLMWSPLEDGEESKGVVWYGFDLLPCPFTGEQPVIDVSGRYMGAPLWESEAVWVGSRAVPKRRWSNAVALRDNWNTRAMGQR